MFVFYLSSATIVAHQPRAVAKVLNSSSYSVSTPQKTMGNNTRSSFRISYQMVINGSHLLTQTYQDEVEKWQLKRYSNSTMISITDSYLPKFQKLIDNAKALQPGTENYAQARDLYIKSLQSEMESYRHFRNFLATNNPAEDRISTELLSSAWVYESNSFAAFNNATNNSVLLPFKI
jgi:hypothetical protein